MTVPFRCSAASRERRDPLPGTASTVRSWLLVENPGPWGADAVRDNRMPPAVKSRLAEQAATAGVRVLLVRRHHRRAPRRGFHAFAAYADPHRPWLESGILAAPEDLLDLDLAALAGGRSPGLAPDPGSLLGVCTHGRHDACCAERGRPVAAALTAARPEETWEVSHIGGDRFAGNLVVLPHGLYYGGLDAGSAVEVGDAHARGEVVLDHLRGRSGLAMPVQAAEIGLRRALDETGVDAVRFVRRQVSGATTRAEFDVIDGRYAVEVVTSVSDDSRQLTCSVLREVPAPRHDVVEVRRLDPGD
ncbi:sucrase ferredoxin [Nocardioides sp.]|uniref:sucrase ferredoxin n=1 Tax=Nocardioides sp. TaxID=35761 RepID=UPI0027325358|nr:sucrase ferredoxin [Nocardioides sp.]MDP3893852.1 sucrase ferredoxin [Nocardioides sp.]